jgi:hypothetical protein
MGDTPAFAYIRNDYPAPVDIKTYNGKDIARVKSAHKYTVPGNGAETQVFSKEPGKNLWIKIADFEVKVPAGSRNDVPLVCPSIARDHWPSPMLIPTCPSPEHSAEFGYKQGT